MSEKKKTDLPELVREINWELLSAAGYTAAQLAGFGDLSQLPLERLEALITQKAMEATGEELSKKKLRFSLFNPKKKRAPKRTH